MHVAVVEDEEVAAERLIRLVGKILGGDLESILRADSLASARQRLAEQPVDLLLLDLNLHGEDGFRLLSEAAAGSFQTIIVSAQHGQAVRAFEFGVTDFVAKPYDEERLRLAIHRVTERDESLRSRLKYLAVRRGPAIVPIPLDTVLYARGADDYSELRCRDGSSHLHGKTLNALMHLLPRQFERVHRSYIVDMGAIESLRSEPGGRHFLRLVTGEEVPVSRACFKDLKTRMG